MKLLLLSLKYQETYIEESCLEQEKTFNVNNSFCRPIYVLFIFHFVVLVVFKEYQRKIIEIETSIKEAF